MNPVADASTWQAKFTRFVKVIAHGIALVPFIHLVVFYTTVLLIYISSGSTPRFNDPDPKFMGIYGTLLLQSFIVSLLSPFLFFPTWIYLKLRSKSYGKTNINAYLMLAGFGLLILLFKLDPGRYYNWLID